MVSIKEALRPHAAAAADQDMEGFQFYEPPVYPAADDNREAPECGAWTTGVRVHVLMPR